MDKQLLFFILFIVLILGLGVFRRWATGKAAAAGERRRATRLAVKGYNRAAKFSESIHIAAPPESARALVAPVLEKIREVKQVETDRWTHAHWMLEDALTYALVPSDGGTELYVARAVESSTGIDGLRAWRKIREQVAEAATAAGVTTTPGTRPLQRAGADGQNHPVWAVD